MEEELYQHGDVVQMKVVRNGEEMIGAEVGSIFVMFNDEG